MKSGFSCIIMYILCVEWYNSTIATATAKAGTTNQKSPCSDVNGEYKIVSQVSLPASLAGSLCLEWFSKVENWTQLKFLIFQSKVNTMCGDVWFDNTKLVLMIERMKISLDTMDKIWIWENDFFFCTEKHRKEES